MRSELASVLDLQPDYVAKGESDAMSLRGLYIRDDIVSFVRDQIDEIATRLLCTAEDVDVTGKSHTGYNSRVPWVRFANRNLSPNPRTGWYAVYLFSETGDEVSLSLNQGTQTWDGIAMRSRPDEEIFARSVWARNAIAAEVATRPRLDRTISLGPNDKSVAYEAGNVVAYRYPRNAIPHDAALIVDMLDMASLLQGVYRAEAGGPAPGDPAPEIAEAERAVQQIAGRHVPARQGFRANAKQRKAIELRAMKVAEHELLDLGATSIKDVSTKMPFDFEVVLDGVTLSVEVKGTAGAGAEVLLTRGEVLHHEDVYPDNALVVVSGIVLQGPPDAPEAVGGTVAITRPWQIEPDGLTPISYRYAVEPSDASPTPPD